MKNISHSFRTVAAIGFAALSLTACGGGDGDHGTVTAFDTDPFTGSTALSTAGRQVFSGLEKTLPAFDVQADGFVFVARAFGLEGPLSFVNAPSSGIPAGGATVIVLQDTDDDNNPATPFAAGNAATLIAGKVAVDGAGFFIYRNSVLNVNRLVFSTNLNDPTADLSVLARISSPTGQGAVAALPGFRSGNFSIQGVATTFGTAPFTGSTALTTAGRQVFAGLEKTLPDFVPDEDGFVFSASAFGVSAPLGFVNAPSSGIPASGANLIVLQDTDDDNNPATPFGAGNAATVIAGKITVDGSGFFIYHNSTLNVNRLVFSTNLNDASADLSVLARIASPTGQGAIGALPGFKSANFSVK
jgi:hypothetical protein